MKLHLMVTSICAIAVLLSSGCGKAAGTVHAQQPVSVSVQNDPVSERYAQAEIHAKKQDDARGSISRTVRDVTADGTPGIWLMYQNGRLMLDINPVTPGVYVKIACFGEDNKVLSIQYAFADRIWHNTRVVIHAPTEAKKLRIKAVKDGRYAISAMKSFPALR